MSPHEAGPRAARWMAGWQFPVFALALLATFTGISLTLLVIPTGESGFGQFADAFRTWCFGYDPATGRVETAYVVMLFANPMLLAAFLVGVWGGEMRRGAAREGRRVAVVALAGAVTVTVAASAFAFLDPGPETGELPFPAEELRTEHTPPSFTLTDHFGEQVSLEQFAGNVVVITSIYSCCPTACPLILQEAQRVVGSLTDAERNDLAVLAISMDPQRDDVESLAGMANAHGVDPSVFHLLTGDETTINSALDRLGIERRTDPETGMIDHTSVFIVVDRDGRIAYRFTMGDRQEQWLTSALRMLLAEAPGAA